MIGSTAAGTSAAGTVGIIGGTSGVLGTGAAIVSAPATIVAGVVAAVGVAVLGGTCYVADERITDKGQVLSILERIAEVSDPKDFRVVRSVSEPAYIEINYDGTGLTRFELKNLYIVNNVLMNRDWFRNTSIGSIAVIIEPVQNDLVIPASPD